MIHDVSFTADNCLVWIVDSVATQTFVMANKYVLVGISKDITGIHGVLKIFRQII